ncbi:MAG: hypothetical protein ABIK68_18570, partial [bacterium]
MKQLFLKLNCLFEKIPDRVRHNRWKIWIGFLLCLILMSVGLPRLKFDMSMESWFRKSDPVAVAFNRFKNSFGGDDSVYIVYRAKDGDVFSEKSLRAVQKIQEDLLNATLETKAGETNILDHILEVKTLINVRYMDVQGDTLISREFVGESIPTDETTRERLRKQALAHKDYPLFYLSRDSQYGGIFIRTDFGSIPIDEPPESGTDADEAGFDDTFQEGPGAVTGFTRKAPPRFKNTEMEDYAVF